MVVLGFIVLNKSVRGTFNIQHQYLIKQAAALILTKR